MFLRIFGVLALFAFMSCAPAKEPTPQGDRSAVAQVTGKPAAKPAAADDYQQYVAFFEKVYKVFEGHYWVAPNRQTYNEFLEKFRTKIYPQLKGENKSDDYVRWRSAWYLVDELKAKEDKFSQFYPPKPAEKFQQEALGQRIDLGIEGKKTARGFLVTRIEPRSDAYDQGVREEDTILRLDGKPLTSIPQEEIEKALSPLVNTKVSMVFLAHESNRERTISVVSKEYFKQTVFLHPVEVPGIFCLEIQKFNRATGDDLFKFLQLIGQYGPQGLVLDLRGNPGGPPLAAREIASFFLKAGEEFAYFQKRGIPKDSLDVPAIPWEYKFNGPIVILVDEESGSASELFAGVMQFRGRAEVMGTNTAGQVLLKSMFPLDDGSMVALVTAPGYYPDGTRFSFNGVTPDRVITGAPKDGLINFAAAYLKMKSK